MAHKTKAVGLTLAGALALVAICAPAASAQETEPIAHFVCSEYPCEFRGEQIGQHKVVTGGGSTTCETRKFQGTPINGPTTSVAAHAELKDCVLHNNLLGTDTPATSFANECYGLATVIGKGTDGEGSSTVEDEGETVTHYWQGAGELVCPEGKNVIARTYKDEAHTEVHCEYEGDTTVASEADVTVETEGGSAKHIKVTTTGSKFALKRLKGGLFACGPENQTAQYYGETTIEALNEEEEPIEGTIDFVET